jgi:hypothetical protein
MIVGPNQLAATCALLYDQGYRTVGIVDDTELFGTTHYQLRPFRRAVSFEVSPTVAAVIDPLVKRECVRPPIVRNGAGTYETTITVEIHKTIFRLTETEYPALCAEDLREWQLMHPYRVLSLAANLPYLSFKLLSDVRQRKPRCLKMLSDCVRMLACASQVDVDSSIDTADRWNCLTPYLNVLSYLRGLVPDLALEGLEERTVDPVRDVVDAVAQP